MSKCILWAIVVIALFGMAGASLAWQDPYRQSDPSYLQPIVPNGYGHGMNHDATGRPHTYLPQNRMDQGPVFGPVQRDGYGLGVHMDQFGRPVVDSNPYGQ